MKAVLVIDMPSACDECKFETEMLNCGKPMCVATPYRRERIGDDSTRPSWCPLSHPLKRVSNDFYIYDRKYLFDNLDREIDLLKGAKAFEEFMKAREKDESSSNS